ncbi:response regulator [Alteromonas sp. a30]|uniref:response regulator n=1 Tax=Alteromonas sp. a30 TaxID=2730917 RepID=UPI002283164B|nr:response regulator [Alteromonas sp. a30]MCY7293970.1 response regulator [Alteromonas sp. a30]
MSQHRILILDDEPEILKALKRVLRKDFEVSVFTEGRDALHELHQHLYTVLITDMRMPTMDGATFLEKAHEVSPLSKKILLTGYSDPKDASSAINRGHINFYINKPWDNDELISMIKKCVEDFVNEYQQRLINKQIVSQNESLVAQRLALEQQLKQVEKTGTTHKLDKNAVTIKAKDMFNKVAYVLGECIKFHNLDPFGHGDRIASQVKHLGTKFGISASIVYQMTMAARLYEIGKMQMSQEEIRKPDNTRYVDSSRRHTFFLELSSDLLATFNDFIGVSTIVRHIFENVDGTGGPSALAGEKVPIPCQIIRICAEYDNLVVGRTTGSIISPQKALAQVMEEQKNHVILKVRKAFYDLMLQLDSSIDEPIEYALSVSQLKPGMILVHDVPLEAAKSNYLNKGHVLTVENLENLKKIESNRKTPLIVYAYPHLIEDEDDDETESEEQFADY